MKCGAMIRYMMNNVFYTGVEVKMITGDHLNIAKETARLIGMGINIHPGEATREGTESRNELIREANGFAQVSYAVAVTLHWTAYVICPT